MKRNIFVLSGGGAKGSFQAGAMYELLRRGIKPALIVGTSVGSINAYMYAMGGLSAVIENWLSIKSSKDIYKTQWLKVLFRANHGLYSLSPLRKALEKIYRVEHVCEAKSVYVDAVTACVKTTSTLCKNRDEIIDGVIASSAIPFTFEPVMKDGQVLVDGGVRDMVPVLSHEEIRDARVYVIGCNPVKQEKRWQNKTHFDYEIGMRALDILERETYLDDIAIMKSHGATIITPPKLIMDTLDFYPDKIKENIALGRRSAFEVLNGSESKR